MELSEDQRSELLRTLQARFDKNPTRHTDITWAEVSARLDANPNKLETLYKMEHTGGEPDVIGQDDETGEVIFCDCAKQSPNARRSLCYDRAAWESRNKNKPESNAVDVAAEIGIELLTADQYHQLQSLGEFDTTTSSWLLTPPEIRDRGGAIFGDRRYDHTFIYHNGAESYYAARGFRGLLRV